MTNESVRDWLVFFLAGGPFVGGILDHAGVSFDFFVCPSRILIGLPCVTQGMTRSGRALYDVRIFESLRMNPITIPLLILCFSYLICFISDRIAGTCWTREFYRARFLRVLYGFLFFVTVVYISMVINEWSDGYLYLHIKNSMVGDLAKTLLN